MIELKNVSKVYKNKKEADIVALENVSIKFPEKGLVFILCKNINMEKQNVYRY